MESKKGSMAEIKYILRYLPMFYDELESIAVYIAEKLLNPQAAQEYSFILADFSENAVSVNPFNTYIGRKLPVGIAACFFAIKLL